MLFRFKVEKVDPKKLEPGKYTGFIEYETLPYPDRLALIADISWKMKLNKDGEEVMVEEKSKARQSERTLRKFIERIKNVDITRVEDGFKLNSVDMLLDDSDGSLMIETASVGIITGVQLGKD